MVTSFGTRDICRLCSPKYINIAHSVRFYICEYFALIFVLKNGKIVKITKITVLMRVIVQCFVRGCAVRVKFGLICINTSTSGKRSFSSK